VSGNGLEKSLPSSWYHSEAIFRIEREHLFCREWFCALREEELPRPGDHRVLDLFGESVLVVRNREGALRAFYNVCRHRGARLCRAAGERDAWGVELAGGIGAGRLIVCPYHRWSYDLDGALVAAPHLTGNAEFNKADFHLYPVGVECWGGFVFLHLTPAGAAPLAAQLGETPARVQRYPLAELGIGATRRYEVAANWKILCENYNECYHCGGVHPELCAIVPAFREGGGSSLDWARGVPHRDGAYTVFLLRPLAADRTEVVCHFLFERPELEKAGFDAAETIDFWDLVNRQDWSVCESVQRGIAARVHESGWYAPMEDFNLDIRRYVTMRIGPYVPAA